ncbi:hypothetical protein HERIO_589 [Hepatospora eriocheir]|uniref:Uncharacterized protein n=1 Tax=Hepatospora eriocheir TaxID=1081669 RepID=A0A1X0QCL4_9MICR|nr:hypothetical protein HERIO_589 [Hepatospora eriocheir]
MCIKKVNLISILKLIEFILQIQIFYRLKMIEEVTVIKLTNYFIHLLVIFTKINRIIIAIGKAKKKTV